MDPSHLTNAEMAPKNFHEFPKLNEDCRRLIWELAFFDEKIIEVEPHNISLEEHPNVAERLKIKNFQDVLFPIAYVSHEARNVALRVVKFTKLLIRHNNFVFYTNMSRRGTPYTWRRVFRGKRYILYPEDVYLKIPGSISDTPNSSEEKVIPIPLYRLAVQTSCMKKSIGLPESKNLREILIVTDLDFQGARPRVPSVFVRGNQEIQDLAPRCANLARNFDIYRAYREAHSIKVDLEKTWCKEESPCKVQIVRWSTFEETIIRRSSPTILRALESEVSKLIIPRQKHGQDVLKSFRRRNSLAET